MSYLASIDKAEVISRVVGGQPLDQQEAAKKILADFIQVIGDQLKFGNRVMIADFGTFEAEERQLPGKDAKYTISFKPGAVLNAAAKHLNQRFPKGMPDAMRNVKTGKVGSGNRKDKTTIGSEKTE